MSIPPRPDGDQPDDAATRQFLWRLRARLVRPLPEERVSQDLDQMLTLAAQQAHERPAEHEVTRAIHPVDGQAEGEAVADATAAEPAPVADLSARRAASPLVRAVSRVAAAAIVLLAVGTGVSVARDGTVSLDALLGRTSGEQDTAFDAPQASGQDGDENELDRGDASGGDDGSAGGSVGDDLSGSDHRDADRTVPEVDEPPRDTGSDAGGDDAADDGGGGSDAASDDAAGSSGSSESSDTGGDGGTSGGSSSNGSGSTGSGSDGSGSSGSGSDGSESGGSSGSGGGSGDGGSDSSDGGSDGDGSSDDEVIAAPPDDDVDGFGGARPCEGDDCDDEDDDAADERDDLASRRAGGSSEDDEDEDENDD